MRGDDRQRENISHNGETQKKEKETRQKYVGVRQAEILSDLQSFLGWGEEGMGVGRASLTTFLLKVPKYIRYGTTYV
jgi:hypothetical protein